MYELKRVGLCRFVLVEKMRLGKLARDCTNRKVLEVQKPIVEPIVCSKVAETVGTWQRPNFHDLRRAPFRLACKPWFGPEVF